MDDRQPTERSLEDASTDEPTSDEELHAAPEPDRLADDNYVGEDNIREGRVGGVMGSTHQQGGQGQGG